MIDSENAVKADRPDDAYIYKLSDFEGPLDLLLHLVRTAKIEIKNIFMSDITEQFLEYMDSLDTIDMDKAAEFVDVASTLVEIKVRALLPETQETVLQEEEDPKEQLIKKLEEYSMLKEAGEKLRQKENVNVFFKSPAPNVGDFRLVLKSLTLDNMIDAFSGMIHKIHTEQVALAPKKIIKERFSVSNRMNYISELIKIKKTIKFEDLFEDDFSKAEKINTFLALLELLKLNIVTCSQKEVFGDLYIKYIEVSAG